MTRFLFNLPIWHQMVANSRSILRWPIIAGVILTCTYIIPHLPQIYMLLLLSGVVGLGITLLFLNKPIVGVLAMIPACLVIPLNIGTGTGTSVNAGILLLFLLLGLWLLDLVVRKQQLQLPRSPIFLPLLLLVLTSILAFVVGQLPWFPVPAAPLHAQMGGLAIFVLSAGAFLLVVGRVHRLHWLECMTWLFLILGAVYILGRITPGGARILRSIFLPETTGSLFWVWLVSLALSQGILNQNLGRGWRIALILLTVATVYVGYVLGNDWKSGWVPPLVSIVTIFVARWWRLGVLCLVAGLIPAINLVSRLIETDEYSYLTRLDALVIVWEIVRRSPILGLGPANYYWYTSLFPIRGYAVAFNSHNQYIDLIAQTGILGLLCFLWFAGALLWFGWQLRTRVPIGFARAYVYGALGGIAGTLVAAALGDWVLPFVYNIGLRGMRASLLGWMFMGGLVALEQMLSRHSMDSTK